MEAYCTVYPSTFDSITIVKSCFADAKFLIQNYKSDNTLQSICQNIFQLKLSLYFSVSRLLEDPLL